MIIFLWFCAVIVTILGLWALWELVFWGRMGKLPRQEQERKQYERLPGAVLITACGCTRDYDGIPMNTPDWVMQLDYPIDGRGYTEQTFLGLKIKRDRRTFRYEGRDDRGVRIFRETRS